jgi:hypothetical protein
VGGLVGNRACLDLKRGMRVFGVLWVAVVTAPGLGKSPALAHARAPFGRLQTEAFKGYKDALQAFETEEALWASRQ